jgi:aminoglycoside phosphotransferase (APT) family kinase protein
MHSLSKLLGRLNHIAGKLKLQSGIQLHKRELSRHKKPCLTYKLWQGDSEKNAFVVKFNPKVDDGWTDVEEEYKIHHIVKRDTTIPVPDLLYKSTAEDERIVGTKFIIMKFVSGHTYADASELPKHARRAILESAVKQLARIHRYYWVWVYGGGLEVKCDYTKRQEYWEDMVDTWYRNYFSGESQSEPTESFFEDAKASSKPTDGLTTLIHGDFSLSNLVFDDKYRVIAVLDWKTSKNGSPMSDLGYFMMMFLQPSEFRDDELDLAEHSKLLLGSPDFFTPSEKEMLKVYKSAVSSVHTVSDKEYNFAKAVNCIRWISIIQTAADQRFKGHESQNYESITDQPEGVIKLLTRAGERFMTLAAGREPPRYTKPQVGGVHRTTARAVPHSVWA